VLLFFDLQTTKHRSSITAGNKQQATSKQAILKQATKRNITPTVRITNPIITADSMAYAYYYDLPPPLVDHQHERPHQHQSLLQYLSHRHPRPEEHPNQPDVDIRDAVTEYLVEIEVPGIKDPKDVSVSYTSDRSILISGTVARPDYGYPEEASDQESLSRRDSKGQWKEPTPHGVHLLVGERKIGPFRRYLNFPSDVEKVTVKLDAGLLKIRAPKKAGGEDTRVAVHV